jgi:hypothetical protein
MNSVSVARASAVSSGEKENEDGDASYIGEANQREGDT